MEAPPPDAGTAWRELLDGVAGLDAAFLEGDRAVEGDETVARGYSFLATVLGLALDIFVFADPARPRFVDINAPHRPDLCWGGDNTDASYQFCAVDPTGTYRVSGRRGDSVYFSVTVYNQPAPGQWSDRIVGIVNDTDLSFDADGRFELLMGPTRPAGWDGPFIRLDRDAAHVVTRDYQADFDAEARTRFDVEVVEPPAPGPAPTERMAAGLRAARAWIEQQLRICPLPLEGRAADDTLSSGHVGPSGANTVSEPYRVPEANFGWSARDACYAFATFDLADDEALVLTHRPPVCRFWNLNAWDPFMAKLDHRAQQVSVNGEHAHTDADGSVTVVVATGAHPHPNAVSTCGLRRGVLAFRWFLAEEVPARPTARVVPLADAPTA
jgi:hypothetical protein